MVDDATLYTYGSFQHEENIGEFGGGGVLLQPRQPAGVGARPDTTMPATKELICVKTGSEMRSNDEYELKKGDSVVYNMATDNACPLRIPISGTGRRRYLYADYRGAYWKSRLALQVTSMPVTC